MLKNKEEITDTNSTDNYQESLKLDSETTKQKLNQDSKLKSTE